MIFFSSPLRSRNILCELCIILGALRGLTLRVRQEKLKQIRQQLRHHPDKSFALAVIMTDTINFPLSLLN